jgi:hypothetical protein
MAVSDGPNMEKILKAKDSQLKKNSDAVKRAVDSTIAEERGRQNKFNRFINGNLKNEKNKGV